MDEISRYILYHCRHLLTDAERSAWNHFVYEQKIRAASTEKMRERLRQFYGSPDENALALMADGLDSLHRRIVERILREHGDSILNRCPRCGTLCRTPRARQCPKCFYDWHTVPSAV